MRTSSSELERLHVRPRLPPRFAEDQNAERARGELGRFVHERGIKIAATYVENESGASLQRPKLFQLLADCHPGDVLLVEQVDRLSPECGRLGATEGGAVEP